MDYSLNTIFTFIIRVFEVMAEFLIAFSILDKKVKIRNIILFSIIEVLITTISKNVLPYSISWLVPPIIMFFVIFVVTKSKWTNILTICLFILLATSILDILLSFTLVTLLGLSSFDELANNPSIFYIGSILIATCMYIFFILIKHFKLIKIASDNERKRSYYTLINILLTFLLILPNCVIIILYFDNKPLPIWIIFLNIFSLIFLMVISIINTNNSVKQAVNAERQIYQQNYITTLENLVDGLRTFKHDYSNTLATINGYIQLEKWDALKKFFEQTLDESKAISTLDKLNPNLIKNPTIFGLLTAKYQKCLKNNVRMNFEILGTLENLEINEFDFTRILGIFLDNAIEAASSTKVKKINLLVSELKNTTTIELSNTYSKKSLANDKIFEKGVSSKGNDRGLGLYKVKQILSKYPNVVLTTETSDKMFLQKLIIPKGK
ncbi:MAG: GHKL domain-containing protein [Clostridia bacterium]|nr:GHKL domain-containing protein [Clostridia bacterium]